MKVNNYINLVDTMCLADYKLKQVIIKAIPSHEIVKRGFSVIVQFGDGSKYLVKRRPQLNIQPIEQRNFTVISREVMRYCYTPEPGDYLVLLDDCRVTKDNRVVKV